MTNIGTIDDVARSACERLEEPVGAPVFWDLVHELYPAVVEAMCEATLMTGEPEQRRAQGITLNVLGAGQYFYSNPPEAVALVRLEGPTGADLRRVSVADLDNLNPGWQNDTGPEIRYWFPFGLTKFGVYPRLTAPVMVVPTYVQVPILTAPPYSGNEVVPFPVEYLHGLESCVAHVARFKEGGAGFQQSMAIYNDFLASMQELGKFAEHKSKIRFTRRGGIPSPVTERQ